MGRADPSAEEERSAVRAAPPICLNHAEPTFSFGLQSVNVLPTPRFETASAPICARESFQTRDVGRWDG